MGIPVVVVRYSPRNPMRGIRPWGKGASTLSETAPSGIEISFSLRSLLRVRRP